MTNDLIARLRRRWAYSGMGLDRYAAADTLTALQARAEKAEAERDALRDDVQHLRKTIGSVGAARQTARREAFEEAAKVADSAAQQCDRGDGFGSNVGRSVAEGIASVLRALATKEQT